MFLYFSPFSLEEIPIASSIHEAHWDIFYPYGFSELIEQFRFLDVRLSLREYADSTGLIVEDGMTFKSSGSGFIQLIHSHHSLTVLKVSSKNTLLNI